MDILKHTPYTESWKREKAEKLKVLWSMGISYGHEITLPDAPKETQELIETTLSGDAPHLNIAEAREAVQDALEEGPIYNQNVLCLGYDQEGDPSVLFL